MFPKEEGKELIRHALSAKDHQGEDAEEADKVEKGAKEDKEK